MISNRFFAVLWDRSGSRGLRELAPTFVRAFIVRKLPRAHNQNLASSAGTMTERAQGWANSTKRSAAVPSERDFRSDSCPDIALH